MPIDHNTISMVDDLLSHNMGDPDKLHRIRSDLMQGRKILASDEKYVLGLAANIPNMQEPAGYDPPPRPRTGGTMPFLGRVTGLSGGKGRDHRPAGYRSMRVTAFYSILFGCFGVCGGGHLYVGERRKCVRLLPAMGLFVAAVVLIVYQDQLPVLMGEVKGLFQVIYMAVFVFGLAESLLSANRNNKQLRR